MRPVTAAVALLAFLSQSRTVALADDLTLILPHPLQDGDMAWIEVKVGTIGRSQEISVTTASGRQLGVLSSFGARAGRDTESGTFTLPVPPDAMHEGRISIRLMISQSGAPPRMVTPEEVRSVILMVAGAPH